MGLIIRKKIYLSLFFLLVFTISFISASSFGYNSQTGVTIGGSKNYTIYNNNSYFNITNLGGSSINASSTTCAGTDKFSAFDNGTGIFTCSTDQTTAGGSGYPVNKTQLDNSTVITINETWVSSLWLRISNFLFPKPDNKYLYNDSTTIFLNETKLNDTIRIQGLQLGFNVTGSSSNPFNQSLNTTDSPTFVALNINQNITMTSDEGCIYGRNNLSHVCMDETSGLHIGYHPAGSNPTHTVYTGGVVQQVINGVEVARFSNFGLNVTNISITGYVFDANGNRYTIADLNTSGTSSGLTSAQINDSINSFGSNLGWNRTNNQTYQDLITNVTRINTDNLWNWTTYNNCSSGQFAVNFSRTGFQCLTPTSSGGITSQQANDSYINKNNESNLNVNSSTFWDGINSIASILGSAINNNLNWLNWTQIIPNFYFKNETYNQSEINNNFYNMSASDDRYLHGNLINYFYNTSSDIVATYFIMNSTLPQIATEKIFLVSNVANGQALMNWTNSNTNITFIQGGAVHYHFHLQKTVGAVALDVYAQLYKSTVAGVETLLSTSETSTDLPLGTEQDIDLHGVINDTILSVSDRLVVKLIASAGIGGQNIEIHTEGTTASRLELPIPISSIVGATGAQGTAGTNGTNGTVDYTNIAFVNNSNINFSLNVNASRYYVGDKICNASNNCFSLNNADLNNSGNGLTSLQANDSYIKKTNETNLNVNKSNFWGNSSAINGTQYDTSKTVLTLLESWLVTWFNSVFRNFFNQDLNTTATVKFNALNLTGNLSVNYFCNSTGSCASFEDFNRSGSSGGFTSQQINDSINWFGTNLLWNSTYNLTYNSMIGNASVNYTTNTVNYLINTYNTTWSSTGISSYANLALTNQSNTFGGNTTFSNDTILRAGEKMYLDNNTIYSNTTCVIIKGTISTLEIC